MVEAEQVLPQGSPAPQRRKRKNSALDSPQKSHVGSNTRNGREHATTTPGRRSKKVRFSDSSVPVDTNPLTTGITPYLRRSSLGTPRRNRPNTPAVVDIADTLHFTPIRQVLGDRVKRRIQRNRLSEEMNEYAADKKTNLALQKKIAEKDAELKELKAQIEAAKVVPENPSSRYSIPPASQVRVDEVEAELEALRQSFGLEQSEPVHSWKHVPVGRLGPSSEGGDTIQIYEDEDVNQHTNAAIDADSLAMGLELEAALQAKKSFLGSFRESNSFTEMNFADSPARRQHKAVGTSPRTPRTFYHDLSKQLKLTTNRAEEAELALKALEDEVCSLGFGSSDANGMEVVASVADHFRQARLELERSLPGETVIGFENAKVLPEIISKLTYILTQLRTKEAELKAARDQQHNLKGNFEKAILAAEKATSRVRDLESSIDSTAEEMLILRIRSQNLEKDLIEKEKDIQTLTTALEKYRADVSRLETLITSLESNHASILSKHDQTISELEAKAAAETRGRRAAENSAVARLAKISELESALSTARSHAETVEEAMAKLQSDIEETSKSQTATIGGLNTRINNLSTALASANAEVEKLKITKSRLEERVTFEIENGAQAIEAIQNQFLKSIVKSNETKKSHLRGAKVRSANWQIESDGLESDGIEPMTPTSIVRFSEFSEEFSHESKTSTNVNMKTDTDNHIEQRETRADIHYDLPATIELGRGTTPRERSRSVESRNRKRRGIMKPRRRYDSGIGISEASDLDQDNDCFDDSGIMTPDLSSDADLRMDTNGHGNVEMVL